MSGLIVPAAVYEAQRAARVPARVTAKAHDSDLFWTTEAVVEQRCNVGFYPLPRGHKIALMLVKPPSSLGGVELPEEHLERKGVASTTGVVLAIGPRAFNDQERFEGIRDCEVGEVVLIPKYSGQVIRIPGIDGNLFSIVYIQDDQITAGWGDMTVSASGQEPEEPRAPVAASAA